MSQHNLQQRSDKDYKFAPSERPKRRRPIAAAHRPVIAALALTASFIIAALVYVSSYARLAQLEYRRQALTADARGLEAENAQLRYEVERARAQEHVVSIAQTWGMTLADPSSQVDYILMPERADVADAPGVPEPYAVLRNAELAQQVGCLVTTGWAGAAGSQQVARP
jgi:cell division protein FtsB